MGEGIEVEKMDFAEEVKSQLENKNEKARRVLPKEEWFSGANEKGFDEKTFESLAKTLIEAKRKNILNSLVLGGGNIYRGRELASKIDQVSADYIGMLSTIMNGIALSNFLSQ